LGLAVTHKEIFCRKQWIEFYSNTYQAVAVETNILAMVAKIQFAYEQLKRDE